MNWDSIPLSDVLQIQRDYITPNEQTLYRYVSLRPYPRGLRLTGQKKGGDFRGKQHQITRAAQFVISRTRTQQRYWGLVQPEQDGAFVHRSVLCFDLHPDLNSHYFAAYLATSLFSKAVVAACTKQSRLDVRRFGRIQIPFPSVDKQARIAEVWQFGDKALKHTVEMYHSITEIKTVVAADLFNKTAASWETKNLGDYITFGQDSSVDYPLYITTNGKLTQAYQEVSMGLLPNAELDPNFLQYYLEHQKHRWSNALGNISTLETVLSALPIPIPTLYEQRKVVSLLQQHDDALHKLKIEQHELRHLTQGMMQQIFTGTLPLQEAITLFHTF